MKKSYVRLVALAICAVMVLGLVPAKANAVALDGKVMPKLESIQQDQWGEYSFTTIEDLVELCAMAAATDEYVYTYYTAGKKLNITKNVTIPENMGVYVQDTTLSIASGVTVAVEGFVVASDLDIYGTVNVAQYGDIGAYDDINIYGQVNNLGWLSIYGGLESQINGLDKVNFGETGGVWVGAFVSSGAELVEYCAIAESKPINWNYYIDVGKPIEINNSFTIPVNVGVSANEPLQINGDLTILGSLSAYQEVTLNGKVSNGGHISIWYDHGGSLTITKPELYTDAGDNYWGSIGVESQELTSPDAALHGISSNDFYNVENYDAYWYMSSYKGNPSSHEHVYVMVDAIAPTCLTPGQTERIYCAECGIDLVSPEVLAALGHDYGLAADGKTPDFWDTTCDVCGAERVVDKFRPTHSMYRMYNPNTGEHFYTGDKTERQMLEAAGWKYEGVGFTFPASTGKPVYRLFQPSTGEHLYTMDEAEKAALLAQGWNFEGIAFNSGNENEVPQYRLYNPNVTVGAYHFTASIEERNVLLAAGWQDQGIGFYTCWQ